MRRPLGQHFLIRHSVVHRILRALELKSYDRVLEIGPGKGALTGSLAARVEKLLLVEKDEILAQEMRERLANREGVEIFAQDILKSPWDQIVERLGEDFKIVSNLPYQAATAILIKILTSAKPGTTMVLMFQKEVGDRILAHPHTKAFGSLTVFTQLFAKVRLLFEVPPLAFRPPPKVMSSVLKFRLREQPLLPSEKLPRFEQLLEKGFAHRRKMLRQNLREYFQGESAQDIEGRLVSVQASPQARAEELSTEQWLALFGILDKGTPDKI
jgi:16S rRNA (adenine1518-N6/adenine1519-N6)-dimethyltransferase